MTTIEELSSLVRTPKTVPTVHGLKELVGQARRNLPFQLSDDQTAFTCICGSGWMTIGPRDGVDEAYRIHVHGE